MTDSELSQRLAAILAADAAGYSRLMSVDERATIASLDAARAVFRREIASRAGRVVDTAGDSVLAVFESATGAVAAALAVQQEIEKLCAGTPDDRRMRFRIGVHLGDVIEKEDGTVYGDGVNVAARLQSLAEPGGITVSESIRAAVRNKVTATFEDQGTQSVKNIAEPVHLYRVRAGGTSTAATSSATHATHPSLPDKPSIAVLPFTNMSGDPEQEYFADGIAEDIITELTRFQRLFVIARNTSFTYKGRSVDVKAVARELGVQFVLEGSVRKAATRVRITAQLINGETGAHVWAERYEDVLSDVFELQERITRQVVGSMVPELEAEQMRLLDRGQQRFGAADDLAWRAAKAYVDSLFTGDPALAGEAIRLSEQAIDQDAQCVLGWLTLARAHASRVFFGWTDDRSASIEAARRAVDVVMRLAPTDSRSYFARGQVAIFAGDHAAGAADARRAHEINPSDSTIAFFLSWIEAAQGNVERAKALAAHAIRVSPKDRWLGAAYLAYAMCAFIERDFPRLREWAELAVQAQPAAPIRRTLMMAYAAEVGDLPLLRLHRDTLHAVAPDFIPSLFRGDYRPFHRPEHMAMFLESLRKAQIAG